MSLGYAAHQQYLARASSKRSHGLFKNHWAIKSIYHIDVGKKKSKHVKQCSPGCWQECVLSWCHAGSSDISPLSKTALRCNNGGNDDESYHDDVGQMRWAQSVDPARAPHHWSAHVGDGHRQRACREKRGERNIREGRHTRRGDESVGY